MRTLKINWILLLLVMGCGEAIFLASPADAGVFNLPRFLEPGVWSLGVEPEVTLTNGAGVAGTAKFTYGLFDLSNVQFGIGTGQGPRRFRVGGAWTFDFIPDLDGQPGMGIALQMYYVRLLSFGQLEVTAAPYIHKTLHSGTQDFDPFLSVPAGVAFKDGTYKSIVQIVFGSFFKSSEHIGFVTEVGVNVSGADSYVSGGVVYQH